MEALAVGLPLIATDIPVFREYLEDGVTALLASPGDHADLTRAMRRLIDDEALRDRLAGAGSAMVQGFSWERAAQDHRTIYDRIRTARAASR
jgi:glycosyltransferase involved in cell wall biosynthesis